MAANLRISPAAAWQRGKRLWRRYVSGHKAGWALAGAGLLLLLYYLLWLSVLLDQRQQYSQQLAQGYRLQGLIEQAEQISTARQQAETQLAQVFIRVDGEAAAASSFLQRQLREQAEQAGMRINNTSLVPVRIRDGLELIAVDLDITGTHAQIADWLVRLDQFRPLLLIERSQVQSHLGGQADVVINMQMRIAAVRQG